MQNARNAFQYVLLAVTGVLLAILIASQGNHHRRHGHEAGPWAIRMSHGATHTVAWIIVITLALAFISIWASLKIWMMLGLIAAGTLVELLWNHDLPSPLNKWGYGLAFVLGAVAMFARVVSQTTFVADARAALKKVGITI